jgi:hypothetical protein
MIIEAKQVKTIDVVVDPINVLIETINFWRDSQGIPQAAVIKAGYWMIDESRLRLATVHEMETMDAFKKVANVMKDFN